MDLFGPRRHATRRLAARVLVPFAAGIVCVVTGSSAHAQRAGSEVSEREGIATVEEGTVASTPPGKSANRDSDAPVLSPLHSFLGIDAATGEFLPVSNRGDTPARSADKSATGTGEPPPFRNGRLPQTPEEVNAAIQDVLRQLDGGSGGGLAQTLAESVDVERLSALGKKLMLVFAAILLLYPAGIAFSEGLAWYSRREETGLSEVDHRYYRTRLHRRLTLAGLVATLIAVIALANVNNFWWERPAAFTLFCGVAVIMALWSAALAVLIRQSAKGYSLAMIRDIRRHQLELRQDVNELSRRMGLVRRSEPR